MKYSEVCEAKTPEEMRKRFDKLMSNLLRTHPDVDPKQLRSTQLSNLGYIAVLQPRNLSEHNGVARD